jgi:signal transduction histidine kinase
MAELNRITADIRSTIFDLRSGELASHDAESIVRDVAAELRANTLVEVDLRVEGDYVPRLSAQQADHLRHIATEAFSNVLRHAHAKHVAVRLACTRRRLTLEVSDDGVGYDPAAGTKARGGGGGRRGQAQGLDNMRRRAELLGGRCITRSTPGRGTLLSLTMPVATTRRPA